MACLYHQHKGWSGPHPPLSPMWLEFLEEWKQFCRAMGDWKTAKPIHDPVTRPTVFIMK